MVTQTPASQEIQAWRDELDAVLRSHSFQQAPTLAALLSWLCNKRFAGESSQIKEYSIGAEVLRRGPSFDPDTDSIVRVEVNRLRKRLAAYYAAEGAARPLRIVIAVGQYVPDFQPAPAPDRDRLVAAEAPLSGSAIAADRTSWFFRRAVLLVLAAGVVLLAAALFLRWPRSHPQPAPEAATAPQPSGTAPTFGPPVGDEVRILAGAVHAQVDHAGRLWSADRNFTGGAAVVNTVRHFARTANPGFFRASRQGQFRYDIPLRPGIYELHLFFAETVYGPETAAGGGEGSRLFTVRANGRPLLEHFDVVADTGGDGIADDRVFIDLAPARDGFLHLDFAGENGSAAMLSALEILPGLRGRMRPVRILARQTPYYSNDSQWWSPDDDYDGGQLASYAEPATGTDDPELYESERWGNFSYAIAAPPGRYTVVLHFAARPHAAPALTFDRVFSVFSNGRAILENFDLAQEARQADIVERRITGLEPSAQGKLLLSFVPIKGYASVTGIEVLPE
jgi:hypothetical protein